MKESANQAMVLFEFARVLWREVILNKGKLACAYAVISLIVISIGLVFPKKYEASTTLYADQQNIIKPLLAGKAAITKVQDQAKIVREVIYSPRILSQVVIDAGLLRGGESPAQIEAITNGLRSAIKVRNIGSNFIRLQYFASTPDKTYDVLTSVSDKFIRDTSDRKRQESREAFQFIATQVKIYKSQLQTAEHKLKEFHSTNVDGTEVSARNRISELQSKMEEMVLDIEDAGIRVSTLKKELGKEDEFLNNRARAELYLEKIRNKQQLLDSLRLSYTETYPDVVTLKLQIQDLKRSLETSGDEKVQVSVNSKGRVNPLYEELRSKLSGEKIELAAKRRRQIGIESLLVKAKARLKRIAGKQADLSELTRDYQVTKSIYEGMLERKEAARLSMTLDIEGQGVKYKIQEPAAYPLVPVGLRFFHFALAGPFVGLIAPLALLIVFILIDPRIRFIAGLASSTTIPILGVVPHIQTPLSKRLLKTDIILLAVFLLVVMSVYVGVGLARYNGLI